MWCYIQRFHRIEPKDKQMTHGWFEYDQVINSIQEVKNKMLTHTGSIELQSQLENDHLILPSVILHEIEGNLTCICLNTYGNYVCQKLIPLLSSNQLLRLVNCLSVDFELITKSIPGSCIVSAIITASINEEYCIMALLELLETHICTIICDPQGSHLLQQIVQQCDETRIGFIIELVKENFYVISTDKYGCCLIKKLFERFGGLEEICSQVKTNLMSLADNQFGNYIVQHFFNLNMEPQCEELIRLLIPNIEILAKQKYGSNVLERIIGSLHNENPLKFKIIEILTENEDKIRELAQDRYGNYVLQKCLEVAGDARIIELLRMTRNVIDEMKPNTIKTRILARLNEIESLQFEPEDK